MSATLDEVITRHAQYGADAPAARRRLDAATTDRGRLLVLIDEGPAVPRPPSVPGAAPSDPQAAWSRAKKAALRTLARDLTPFVGELRSILVEIVHGLRDPSTSLEWSERGCRLAELLGAMGAAAEPAVPELVRVMHGDPRGIGQHVGPALGMIGGEEAIRALNGVWYSGWDRKCCEACQWGLWHLGPAAFPVLLGIWEEGDPLECGRALLSLQEAGYPSAALTDLAARSLGPGRHPATMQAAVFLLRTTSDASRARTALEDLRRVASGVGHESASLQQEARQAIDHIAGLGEPAPPP